MKLEDIDKILEGLNPAVEAIADPSSREIISILIDIIHLFKNENQKLKDEIQDLKEKLNTNSSNSSKAPSSDLYKAQEDETKKNAENKASEEPQKQKKKQGAQPGHPGKARSFLSRDQVDHFEIHQPPEHCDCGASVGATKNYRRHQVYELPKVKAIVTEYQLFDGVCCGCGKKHYAELPVGIPTGMLGPQALAKIGTLTGDYRMSKRNVVDLMSDFYGLEISVGTVSNAERLVSAALEKPVEEAKKFIPSQKNVNADETGNSEKGEKMWTWTFIASLVAVLIIRPSRAAQVVKDFLGTDFKGILNSDRWSAYTWLALICRQLCWAHLIRDFTKISEREGASSRIGNDLLVCARTMFHAWHKIRDGTLSRIDFQKQMIPIRQKVEDLIAEGMHCDHIKTAGTCKQIFKVKEALWTFINTVGIEPTNNLAERVLRRIVIWRKTSFGTQSSRGTLYLERIMTTVATCKLQNKNVLDFVEQAVKAHLAETDAPSLLPLIQNDQTELKLAA